VAFYRTSLRDLVWAVTDDRDVRDYLHGGLPGNQDWRSGYQGRCGVRGVDRVTRRHWVRPGAAVPGAAARASGIA
jgi:beta-glucosidase/6-phospho-beta-glucosidase/beta-galactosidase